MTLLELLRHALEEITKPWYLEPNTWAAIATTIAAGFTGWQAWETRKNVHLIQEDMQNTYRPYLSFVSDAENSISFGMKIEKGKACVNVQLPVKNVGKKPLYYEITELKINGKPYDVTSFKKVSLFPQQIVNIWISNFETAISEKPIIHVAVRYFTNEGNTYTISRTMIGHPRTDGTYWFDFQDDAFD